MEGESTWHLPPWGGCEPVCVLLCKMPGPGEGVARH